MSAGRQSSKASTRPTFEASPDAIYGRAARMYWRAGFSCPLPLPHGKKEHPPTGYTGKIGYDERGRPRLVSVVDLKRWEREQEHGNIALRMVGGLIGIDVDAYDGKIGGEVFADMVSQLGELPPTYVSTARDDGVSGIRLFTLPEGVRMTKEAEARIIERFGQVVNGRTVSNIEIIREDHRYMVVWPSIHPDTGDEYGWSFDEAPLFDEVPDRARVPELPAAWARFLFGPKEKRAEPAGKAPTVKTDVWDDDEDDESDENDLETPNSGERAFDDLGAQNIIKRQLKILEEAPRSRINDTLNEVAFYLFHFAPAFIDEKRLARKLIAAQEVAWIASGGEDDGDHTAARKTIRGARAAARRSWTAVLADAGDESPDPMEALAGEAGGEGGNEANEDERASTKKVGIFFLDARFSELVAETLREAGMVHTVEMGWMRWNGVNWERTGDRNDDAAMEVTRRWVLKRTKIAKTNLDNVPEGTPESEIKNLEDRLEAWRTMCSRSRRSAVVSDARSQVCVKADVFDKDPDLLNTPSGVVDLRTGDVLEHDRDRWMTKVTTAPYMGVSHTHEVWERALEAVPDDSRDWVQVFMGQGITGRLNTEGRLLLLDGNGNNGKGALTNEGCVWALGDYAVVLSESLLLANSSQHPTEKMALRGARLTLIDETPEARRLDTQRLKKMLDQPVLAGARYLYKEEMRVVLTHTMVVMTNHLPAVTEYDWGTWRRLVRLRMPWKFVPSKQFTGEPGERVADPTIKVGLKEDPDVQAACLAWLVQGAMKWYAGGRVQEHGDEPERVKADTKAWRGEGDLIMNYAEEFLEAAEQRDLVVASEVYRHFAEWCERNGHKPWSSKTFVSRFKEHETIKGMKIQSGRVRNTGDLKITHPPEAWNQASGLPAQLATYSGVRYQGSVSPGNEIDDSVFQE